MTGLWLRRLAVLLLTGVLSVTLLGWRAISEGEAEMARSDAAFNEGDLPTSLLHARRAAVLYVPNAPHVRRAYGRLTAIAIGAESRGDTLAARAGWRAIRGAALETRHVWVPERQQLDQANRNLARLSQPTPDARARVQREKALALLSRDTAPQPSWMVVLAVGFALAAVGLGVLGARGVNAAGQLRRRPALVGGLITLLGIAGWALAVTSA